MTQRAQAFKLPSLASRYKKYREEIPEECVKKVINFLEEKFKASECIALDVGCGSGQSTKPFAPFMKEVIGVDSSEAQLSEVDKETLADNIKFRFGHAEALPVDDESVHLVTAISAAHWFDYPLFIKEVDRVLVPGGVLAMIGSDTPSHSLSSVEDIENIIQELKEAANANLKNEFTGSWIVFYENVDLPYKSFIRDHSVEIEKKTSLCDSIEMFKTMASVAKFIEDEPEKAKQAFQTFHDKVRKALNLSPSTSLKEVTFTLTRRYIILLSRKPEK